MVNSGESEREEAYEETPRRRARSRALLSGQWSGVGCGRHRARPTGTAALGAAAIRDGKATGGAAARRPAPSAAAAIAAAAGLAASAVAQRTPAVETGAMKNIYRALVVSFLR